MCLYVDFKEAQSVAEAVAEKHLSDNREVVLIFSLFLIFVFRLRDTHLLFF